jgi:hypothetical protein
MVYKICFYYPIASTITSMHTNMTPHAAHTVNQRFFFVNKKDCITLRCQKSDTCLKIHQNPPLVLPHAWKPEHVACIVQGPTGEPESVFNKMHSS